MEQERILSILKKVSTPSTYLFDEISSTMDLAKELVQDKNKYSENKISDGKRILVIANSQTAGRGTAGRDWFSKGGLYFTIVDLGISSVEHTSGLSLAIGAIICESLKKLSVPVGLKWPNDIIYFPIAAKEAKKLGGILIETSISGTDTKSVCIGIGVNIANVSFPPDVPAISLEQIAGKQFTLEEVFEILILDILNNLDLFFKNGFSAFKNLWRKHSLMFGSKMAVKTNTESYDCIVDDIADDGALIVRVNDEIKILHSAEVSFIGTQKNLSIAQTIDEYVASFFNEIPENEREEIMASLNEPITQEEELVKEETGSKNISTLIKDMKLGQKVKLAMLGNMGARAILIRENSRQIRQAVMKNPRLTENEVYEFAKNPNLDKQVFQMIGNDNNWMKSYAIQVAIVSNPKTPMEISIRWIKYLKDKELRDLSKSRNIPSALSTQMRKLLETRNKKPGGGGH